MHSFVKVADVRINVKLALQGRHAGQGADWRSREDHDAEWRNVWDLHGHRHGHPLLRSHLHHPPIVPPIVVHPWDFANSHPVSCHVPTFHFSLVNKMSDFERFHSTF